MRKNKGLLLFTFIISLSLALAAHVITTSDGGTSFNFNETVESTYNISVNNTDAGSDANITQVNITLPSEITFVADTNATSAGNHTFSNTSTVLTWSGDGFVMNESEEFFWFNATGETGTYNITVTTTNETGPALTSNLTVEINDTTAPSSVTFVTPDNNANISSSYIDYNLTVTDNGELDNISLRLYNSSNSQINFSSSSSSPLSGNFSNLTDGTYYLNATANDTYGNENDSITLTVTLDTVDPTISFSCTPTDVEEDETITCSCSGTDSGTGVETTSYTANPSTSTAGSYTTTCTVTDYAGNSVNSSVSYTVTEATSSSSGGTSTPTYTVSSSDLSAGYTKKMYKNWELSFNIDNEDHALKVDNITESNVVVSVSSGHMTELTISEDEIGKVDVDDDGYYELAVRLDEIENKENLYYKSATLTLMLIDELIEQPASQEEPVADSEEEASQSTGAPITGRATDEGEIPSNNTFLWIVLGVIAVGVLVFIIMKYSQKPQKKNKRK